MNQQRSSRSITRRDFLKLGGGVVAAVASTALLPGRAKTLLRPTSVVEATAKESPVNAAVQEVPPDLHLLSTDGWAYLPSAIPPWHPDPWAPDPFTTYVFGLRDVTGLTDQQVQDQKGKIQIPAPILWMDQEADFRLKLTNVGFILRPDLVDGHTIHWHGFRNQIPFFDGEPMGSFSVPTGRSFTYFYRPHDPGSYLYHCHFEDTEHVHMGMTGLLFVRPTQNQTPLNPGERYAYNDNDSSTAYDREFVIFLSEIWAEMHWNGAHVQETDWSEYKPDFWLMNGRVYPDTLAPNGGGNDPVTGDLIYPPGRPELQYQPHSSLIQVNAGDRVLLRFGNLGFQFASMTLSGLKMRVIGKDATLLRGQDGTDISYLTNTVSIGPGETADAILTAPTVTSETTFLLYNRNYSRLTNGGAAGYGGQMTEVRVFPAGTLPPQTVPNT